MGMLSFDICALIILAIIVTSIASRKMYVGRSNRLFFALIICIIISTVTDFLAGMYGDIIAVNPDNTGRRALIDYIYFIARNISPLVYVFYVISYTGVWHIYVRDTKRFILTVIPCGISIFLILTNPFTRLIFYFDDELKYCRGKASFVLYIVAIG